MSKLFEVTAPLFAIAGGILCWNADADWRMWLPGAFLMSWGLAWLQARR